ncbi:hypothetical protein [Chitinibacter sp. S2-10]|uniref:hypothetical protein n=1 Tax=Chitinibacter sp. S2-10 TaxID=3373597 RepID=UPI003977CDC5
MPDLILFIRKAAQSEHILSEWSVTFIVARLDVLAIFRILLPNFQPFKPTIGLAKLQFDPYRNKLERSVRA